MNNHEIVDALGDLRRRAAEGVGARPVGKLLNQVLEDIRTLMELLQGERPASVHPDDRLTSLEERVALLESAERIMTQGEVNKMLEQHTPRGNDVPS